MSDNCDLIDSLEREWRDALCAKHVEKLRSLIHPEFKLIGTRASGPFTMSREEWLEAIEKRELIMQCYLLHGQSRVVRESPAANGKQEFLVELTKGPLVRATTFYAVEGPNGRWFVENVDLDPIKDLCRPQG